MKTLCKLQLLVALCAIVALSSCKKNAVEPDQNNTTAAVDNSFAEASFNDVVTISDQAGDDGSLTNYIKTLPDGSLLSTCAVVTLDMVSNPHLITINFGSVNCECKDGKLRRGTILVSFSGKYRDSASKHTITFDNYYVNNYKVDGSKTVTNMGHNPMGHLVHDIRVVGVITDTAGRNMTWNSSRTREWTEGEGTKGLLGWIDDVYSITGSTVGHAFDGTTFSATITEPIIVALSCHWIKQGKFEFTPGDSPTRYFDFGNGVCDALATVTLNGQVYNITMR